MDIETIARTVVEALGRESRGTVVVVARDGSVTTEAPYTPLPPFERRRHAAAVFVVTSAPPAADEVLDRVRQGMRKLRVIR
jgi:hypothetical protein